VPENHTRNLYYLEHLAVLRQLLEQAGFEVRLGSLLPAAEIPTQVVAAGGRPLQLVALERHGDRLRAGDFEPQLVLLNNDLSAGCPPLLQGLAQPVVPAARMGWSERSKTVYFEHYRRVVEEFTAHIGLEDAWLLQASFYDCREIDFMKREGEACVQARVALLLEELHDKYRAYGIGERPFVVIKADAGTYGMAVMTVRSPQEVVALNRRQRTRMATSKEGRKVERVLIQEGVHTGETWGEPGHAAEPVVYMVDHNVVGGFYRVHAERGTEENLNAPGMQFEPLAFADCCSSPDQELSPEAHCNRFYSYGVVARLAVLAAAREAHA